MRLYRYMGLGNLWHVLDIAVRNRVYCAHWTQLNDPLEGHYELYFRQKDDPRLADVDATLRANRERHRIASFSEDPANFLLWSHYADGHKGIALEIEIDTDDPCLTQILYTDFYSVFNEDSDTTLNHPHVFNGKTPEWAYEKEWRIITTSEYYSLDTPCSRILLGSLTPPDRRETLRRILPERVTLVDTRVDHSNGTVKVVESK